MKFVRPVLLAAFSLFVGLPGTSLAAAPAGLRHSTTPMAAARQNSQSTDVLQFRLPDSTFTPALINPFMDGRLSNLDVTGPTSNPLVRDHFLHYANNPNGQDLHRLDGYREQATWGAVEITYEASVFPNAGWALNALRDGVYATSNHQGTKKVERAPEGCAAIVRHPCNAVPYVLDKLTGIYEVVQFNQCLVEVDAEALASAYEQAKDTIMPVVANVMRAGDSVMSNVCAQADPPAAPAMDYNVIVARVEPAGSAPDFEFQHQGLRKVRVGHAADLSVYFSVASVPGPCKAFAEFTVKHGTGVDYFGRTKTTTISTAPTTRRFVETFTPRHTGHEVIVARVTMDGVEQTYTTAVTVTK